MTKIDEIRRRLESGDNYAGTGYCGAVSRIGTAGGGVDDKTYKA